MVFTSRFSPSLTHGLCTIFASHSRFMHPFQAPLDTCLGSPILCQPLSSRFARHVLRPFDCFSAVWVFSVHSAADKNQRINWCADNFKCAFLDTKNDRRRLHCIMDMIPALPWKSKTLQFPPLLNEVQNKGTQGVRARYDAELPPSISIVRHPGRPIILGMEFS